MATVTRRFRFSWGVSGLASTFYVEVNKLSDGSSLLARAAATCYERPASSGNYTVEITTWDTAWNADAVLTVGPASSAGVTDLDAWDSSTFNVDDRNGNPIGTAVGRALYGAPTYYVSKAGNDANDGLTWETAFLTLTHAAAVVPARSMVLVQQGIYNEGSNVLNSAVNCYWRGLGVVRIQSSAVLDTDGAVLYGVSGVVWENFSVENTAASNVAWAGAGCVNFASSGLQSGPASNGRVIYRDIRIIGGNTDGFYWQCSGTHFLEVERMTVQSKWDALYVALPSNASVARFRDVSFVCNGPSDHPSANGLSRGMYLTSAGIIYLENVRGESTAGGATQTTALTVEGTSAGIKIYAKDCRFRAEHNAGQVADVKLDTSNFLYHANCDFSTTVGAGTITAVPSFKDIATTSYATGAIDSNAFAQSAADKVWATAARTVTSAANITSTGGTTVPQTGDSFARIGAAGAGLTALGDLRLNNLDATVGSRLAGSSYIAPPSAAAIDSQLSGSHGSGAWNLSGGGGGGSTQILEQDVQISSE